MYLIEMLSAEPAALADMLPHENLPLIETVSLSSIWRMQAMVKPLSTAKEPVPEPVSASIRNTISAAVGKYDSLWSAGIVNGFWQAAAPLGLDDPDYKNDLAGRILARLEQDIAAQPPYFNEYRLANVVGAFSAMAQPFEADHEFRVIRALYDRHDARLEAGGEACADIRRETHYAINRLQFHLNR